MPSVSQLNHTIISVEILNKGSLDRRYVTISLKSSYVCLRFIFFRSWLLHDCRAKWR